MHIPYTRGPSPVPNGKGAAGDKFRVSGTREMEEGAGANKESGVRVRGSLFTPNAFENASRTRSKLLPLRNFELIKTRDRPKISF